MGDEVTDVSESFHVKPPKKLANESVSETVCEPSPIENAIDENRSNELKSEVLENIKNTYDLLIQDYQDRLSHEEDAHTQLSSQKKKLEGEISNQKKEIEDMNLALQKVSANHSCL